MNTIDNFDTYARSMTHRLLKAAEADPATSMDERSTTVPRTVAMLVATLVLVAGLIVVGTSVLHIQFSHRPVNVATPPPVVTQAPTATPTTTPSPTVAPMSVIANLHMITTAVGWAQRQSDGAILHTTHGVMTWSVATPRIGIQDIIAVAFIDAETARALTAVIPPSGSSVIHSWATNDGGVTWIDEGSFSGISLQYEPDGTLDFVDPDHGWYSVTGLAAAGSSAIYVYRTVDGGRHWSEVDNTSIVPGPGANALPSGCDKNPVSFINAVTGWDTGECAGGSAFLYVTHDGGAVWRAQSLGNTRSDGGNAIAPPQFVSGNVGFMAESVYLQAGVRTTVDVTTNGGATWAPRTAPGHYSDASDFIDAADGWLLMSDPQSATVNETLWVTTDAGRTWANVPTNVNLAGLSIEFVTTKIGWAFTAIPESSGATQGLLQTTDGGNTWTAVTPTISGA
ncbi:MAG TPA: hypothetical protein VI434_09630 [Candidatus Dormibacteraeota bacterium]